MKNDYAINQAEAILAKVGVSINALVKERQQET